MTSWKMDKTLAACAFACLLVGGACITDGPAVLYAVVNTAVPDTTSDEQIGLSGYVERTPQQQDAITVITVTGGAITAVDTANLHGIFTVHIPLLIDADNHLSLTASDNTGAQSASAWQRTVVHRSAAPAASSELARRR
jgi:hypothetical protein